MINARNSEHVFQNDWLMVALRPGIYVTELVPIVNFFLEVLVWNMGIKYQAEQISRHPLYGALLLVAEYITISDSHQVFDERIL